MTIAEGEGCDLLHKQDKLPDSIHVLLPRRLQDRKAATSGRANNPGTDAGASEGGLRGWSAFELSAGHDLAALFILLFHPPPDLSVGGTCRVVLVSPGKRLGCGEAGPQGIEGGDRAVLSR